MCLSHCKKEESTAHLCVREIDLSAEDLLHALLFLPRERRVSILDSQGARAAEARYLIAGFDPFETIEARGRELHIAAHDGEPRMVKGLDVLDALDDRLGRYRRAHNLEAGLFAGACIGTFSYDLVRRIERLRFVSDQSLLDEPDAVLAFYDTLIIHDYALSRTQIMSVAGERRVQSTLDAINDALSERDRKSAEGMDQKLAPSTRSSEESLADERSQSHSRAISNFTPDEYMRAVRRIKELIAAGDIYQANLTQQFTVKLADNCFEPEQIFLRLRRDHPAAFAAFIRRREDDVISASPERFLRVQFDQDARRVEAWPIKGTRPRGRNSAEDARLRSELQRSEKDRAENVMIVDLMRNDLGRVCQYGSIEVPELFSVQEHPTLFHLVSKVQGRLRDDVTAGALLRAAFPCGSITGAPKIRAMEIIDEIEGLPRGLSMGAIGYFTFTGTLDLNVAIRTMTVRDRAARFNVGGGIVADSDPALEYEESLIKARALFNALGVEKGKARV